MKEHHVCPWWLAYSFDNPLRRLIHRPQRMFDGLVRPGMTVMDIGCGMGYFTLAMARLVGPEGRVIAVDLQAKMLEIMVRRARRADLQHRIQPHLCESSDLGVTARADFILAFWMVHEAPDPRVLFQQIKDRLSPEGRLLIAEPRFHVSEPLFQKILHTAIETDFKFLNPPWIALSRTALFARS